MVLKNHAPGSAVHVVFAGDSPGSTVHTDTEAQDGVHSAITVHMSPAEEHAASTVHVIPDIEGGERVVACWKVHMWSRSSQIKLTLFIIFITAIVLFWTLGDLNKWIRDFSRWSEEHRVEGAFGLAGIYCIAAVLLVPALLLTIVAGFILGLPWGFCAVLVGATLGSCLAYLNSRFLLKSWVDEHLIGRYPQLSAFSEVIRKNQFKVVLLLRLSPLVPYNVLNYCLAVMPLDFRPYLLASFFDVMPACTLPGMIPGTLLFVYIGSTAASITEAVAGNTTQTPLQQALFWTGLGLTILLTIAVSYLARRELKKQMEENSRAAPADAGEAGEGRVEEEGGGRGGG